MWKVIRRLILLIILLIIISVGYITFSGYYLYKNAISTIDLKTKIEQIQLQEDYITIDKIPEIYKNAVIAVEDHRFKDHSGIDIIATIRAILANIIQGELEQGGSTITQQLAKNLYFTQEKTFIRKVAELFVAKDLEENYSKDTILELYINTIYYGKGFYGLTQACNGFYKKSPTELTEYEATYLAGMPNAPSIYSNEKYVEFAKKRHRIVLNAMVKYGYLTQEEADKIYNS